MGVRYTQQNTVVQELVLKPWPWLSHFTDQMRKVRGSRKGWTVSGLRLFWVRRTQTVLIFSSSGTVIFVLLTLDQNRKSPPCDDGWVEFSSFMNPIWDKAVFPYCGHCRILATDSWENKWYHQKRPFPAPTPYGQSLYLLFKCTLLGEHCLWTRPRLPASVLLASVHSPAPC